MLSVTELPPQRQEIIAQIEKKFSIPSGSIVAIFLFQIRGHVDEQITRHERECKECDNLCIELDALSLQREIAIEWLSESSVYALMMLASDVREIIKSLRGPDNAG